MKIIVSRQSGGLETPSHSNVGLKFKLHVLLKFLRKTFVQN